MTSTSNRLNKQDCIDLRVQLADLGYGQAEAETPELFAHRLYPVSEHLRAFDPNVVLVVGPRGSGKSALFQAFFSENREVADAIADWMPRTPILETQTNSSEWRRAYPAGTDFPDTQALAKWVSSDEAAKKVWHAMLVRRLADRFVPRHREALKAMLHPPAVAVGELLRAYDRPETSPTAALDELEERLQREDSRIYVGYDELDTLGGFDWTLMARMVRGLMAFWSDYSRRWRRIRAKVFLRSDLFRRHAGMGTADFAKLAANRAELVWSDAALLAMLVKRIANTSGGLAAYCRGARIRFSEHQVLGLIPEIREARTAYPLLERLSGEFMGAGKKKGYVRNWILAHLRDGNDRISPRTLVRLIEQAAGKEAVNLTWVRLFFVDGFFTYSWAFLLADGHFSVRFARGQRPGQRPPASFGRPARPDHGARTLRSSPPPPWTFARRFGTLPWEGRCLCDGRSSDDEVLGTCLLGRVGCHQRSSSHGPTLPPCW